jgi:hypothetical protein
MKMIELKRTTKWDGKIKGLHFEGNVLVDENGEIINLNELLKAAYQEKCFDLSVSSKEEEILEIEAETEDEE